MLFNQKTKYVCDGFFERKVVKADFYKEELSRALCLNHFGHSRTVLVVNLKTGLTKILDGALSYQKSDWDFPIIYLDELFEDLNPLISVTVEAKFPNFFDRDKTPRYNFEELEKFLNNLVRNWIHKNKDYLQNQKTEYLQKNLKDFILSRDIISTEDFKSLFGVRQVAIEYSKFIEIESESRLIHNVKKLISILKDYEGEIDDDAFDTIINGSLIKDFYWELSEGDNQDSLKLEEIRDELEEIGLLYKFILELFKQEEDPELIQELDFAKEYLKEILS